MARVSHITLPDNTDYSIQATGLFYGVVDSTSTATAFTATVQGITELYDGLCVLLKNNVIASKAECTLNINGLGAKKIHYNTAANTQITTQFSATCTALFYYDSTRNSNAGAWVFYYGYDSNSNTIGYQVRTNSSSLPMTSITYRYRILFTSADNAHFVPATNSSSTNATSARTVCQDKINPFGRIVYYGTTASVAAGSRPSASALWDQYTLTIGYSFVVALTAWKPVYVKCAPQSDGSAIIDSTAPFVQTLPSTEDGKIYILLGVAYSETNIELLLDHPVYYYKDGMIRPWTNAVGAPSAATANPLMDGTAAVGSSSKYAKEDHVHPSDTSRVNASASYTTWASYLETTGAIQNLNDDDGIQLLTTNENGVARIQNKYSEMYSNPYILIETAQNSNNYANAELYPGFFRINAYSNQGDNNFIMTPTTTTISNLVTPTNNSDAVPKSYVDARAVPSGGTTGQILRKSSDTDYAIEWASITIPSASSSNPLMDGIAAVGSSTNYARADHVHPSDTSKVDITNEYTDLDITELGLIENVNYDEQMGVGFHGIRLEHSYQSDSDNSEVYIYVQHEDSSAKILLKASGITEIDNEDYSNTQEISISSDGIELYTSVEDNSTGEIENSILITPTSTEIHNLVIPSSPGDAVPKSYVDNNFMTGMTILSYGSSTWNDFITAYNSNRVIYCRASSNSNPGTGSQNRLAFMAYVNDSSTPTNVEFQYYRSVNSHTESQQGDQVFIYKLDKTSGWSVTIREASVKVAYNNGITGTYSNGVMTLKHANSAITAQTTQGLYPITIDAYGHITSYGSAVTIPSIPSVTSSDNGKVLTVVNGAWAAANLPVYNGSVT